MSNIDWGTAPAWVQAGTVVVALGTYLEQRRKDSREEQKTKEKEALKRQRVARLATVTFLPPSIGKLERPSSVTITNGSTETMYAVKARIEIALDGRSEREIVEVSVPSIRGRVPESPYPEHGRVQKPVNTAPELFVENEWHYDWTLQFLDDHNNGWRKTASGKVTQFEPGPESLLIGD